MFPLPKIGFLHHSPFFRGQLGIFPFTLMWFFEFLLSIGLLTEALFKTECLNPNMAF
jgi:hypothetical protein